MTQRLNGKTAVITGGSSGIGEASAKLFAREGAKVYIIGRSPDKGNRVLQEIKDAGGDADYVQCDVSDHEEVQLSCEQIIASASSIDILFNNAGRGERVNFPNETVEGWNEVISINLGGTFYMTNALWDAMIESSNASIINMSSVASQMGFSDNMYKLADLLPSASYFASKAGIEAFTRFVAGVGGKDGVRANAIRPGQIITPLTDTGGGHHVFESYFEMTQILKDPGHPEDVANLALFLASDDSRFITGEMINVDGGIAAKL